MKVEVDVLGLMVSDVPDKPYGFCGRKATLKKKRLGDVYSSARPCVCHSTRGTPDVTSREPVCPSGKAVGW